LAEGELTGPGPELVAERILASFAQPFILERSDVGPLRIGASIGVAIGPRDGPAHLLRDADVALYEAKARGKDGYAVFRSDMRMAVDDQRNHAVDIVPSE
jgi:predicted signal transduction protein with EAL and GGDEF domain